MPYSGQGDEQAPGRARQLLNIARSRPDLTLLLRYVHWRNGSGSITSKEREWVEVNLQCNPLWQKEWLRLVRRGRSSRSSLALACAVSALAVVIMTPLWTDPVYRVAKSRAEVSARTPERARSTTTFGNGNQAMEAPNIQTHAGVVTSESPWAVGWRLQNAISVDGLQGEALDQDSPTSGER